jgi:hypothetical protein
VLSASIIADIDKVSHLYGCVKEKGKVSEFKVGHATKPKATAL